jgi:hypothetical protein
MSNQETCKDKVVRCRRCSEVRVTLSVARYHAPAQCDGTGMSNQSTQLWLDLLTGPSYSFSGSSHLWCHQNKVVSEKLSIRFTPSPTRLHSTPIPCVDVPVRSGHRACAWWWLDLLEGTFAFARSPHNRIRPNKRGTPGKSGEWSPVK